MNESNATPGSLFSSFQKGRGLLLYTFHCIGKKTLVHVPNSLAFPGINHLWLSPMSANIWGEALLIMKPFKLDTCRLKCPEAITLRFPEINKRIYFLTAANFPLIAQSLDQHGCAQQLLLLALRNPLATCGSLTSAASHSIQPNLSTSEMFMTLATLIPAFCGLLHLVAGIPERTWEPTT